MLADGSLALVRAVEGVFDTLTAKLVKTARLEVQEGITIKDADTGQPYCFQVKSGLATTTAGACVSATPTPTPSPTPEPTPEPTPSDSPPPAGGAEPPAESPSPTTDPTPEPTPTE